MFVFRIQWYGLQVFHCFIDTLSLWALAVWNWFHENWPGGHTTNSTSFFWTDGRLEASEIISIHVLQEIFFKPCDCLTSNIFKNNILYRLVLLYFAVFIPPPPSVSNEGSKFIFVTKKRCCCFVDTWRWHIRGRLPQIGHIFAVITHSRFIGFFFLLKSCVTAWLGLKDRKVDQDKGWFDTLVYS